MGELSLESTVTLALLGTVSIGSIILMLMQATKQLFPSLEGQWAIRVTFVYSMFAVALAMYQLGADLDEPNALISIFLGGCGAFVSAVSQYAFLFKRSVEGLPPPPDAEAPVDAFTSALEDAVPDDEIPIVDDAEPITPQQEQELDELAERVTARNLRRRRQPVPSIP